MLHDTQSQYQLNKLRCEELLQQNQKIHLENQLEAHQPVYAPLLAQVGKRLETLGNNLQTRYSKPIVEQTQNGL